MPARRPDPKIPELVFAGSRIAGEILVQFINEDPALQKRIESALGKQARKATNSQLWTTATAAARLISQLQGAVNYIVTNEAQDAMGGDGARHQHQHQAQSPFAVLNCAENAPIEVVEAAYKALARKFHPDVPRTGDAERMKAINLAYAEIRRLK